MNLCTCVIEEWDDGEEMCVFLLPLKNLLWVKLRDYAISRVKPNPSQAFLLQVVELI